MPGRHGIGGIAGVPCFKGTGITVKRVCYVLLNVFAGVLP